MLPNINQTKKYSQIIIKFAKVAKFRQIWSLCADLLNTLHALLYAHSHQV